MLDLYEIFKAAGIEQDSKAKYFAPKYRTCEHTANFVTAVDTAIRSQAVEEAKQLKAWADKESKLRATIDRLRDELQRSSRENVVARLEQESSLSEHSRNRIVAPLAS